MKLNSLQSLKTLATIDTVPILTPLIKTNVSILNIPSQIDLILLSTNLLYQAKLILDGKAKRTGDLKAMECTYQAVKIHEILNDYEHKHLTNKEVQQIKKDYKLNSLYK